MFSSYSWVFVAVRLAARRAAGLAPTGGTRCVGGEYLSEKRLLSLTRLRETVEPSVEAHTAPEWF